MGSRRSILASDLEINGDVISRGPIDLFGRVIGSVLAPEVVVTSTGGLEGNAMALDLVVMGKVQGAIQARSIMLASSSVVLAEVLHERIAIEAGAWFDGELSRRG